MINVTEIRRALEQQLSDLDVETKALLAPTEYFTGAFGPTDELKMIVRVLVGDDEDRIDDLFNEVPEKLEEDKTLGGVIETLIVKQCSGHRVYPGDPPVLGAEWSVVVGAKMREGE